MIAPKQSYRNTLTGTLADLRQLLSRDPDALYLEARELARLLACTECEAEEARQWIAADGLEVAA